MARVDGVHGPEQKQKIEFIDDWSELKGALKWLREAYPHDLVDVCSCDAPEFTPEYRQALWAINHYVPMLKDAYAECFELSLALARAVEAQRASQDDLYVPDALELVSGLANPERTQR